jgi:hypothetical protein
VLQHDLVLDDLDRLGCAEVEIDVAEAANVEAREDAAGGRFDVQAGGPAGQSEQGIVAARHEVAQGIAIHHPDGDRHALDILGPALGRDDDIAEVAGIRIPGGGDRARRGRGRLREGRLTDQGGQSGAGQEHGRGAGDTMQHDGSSLTKPRWQCRGSTGLS